MQHTIAAAVEFHGVGVHRGKMATARLLPAAANTGILFKRVDMTDRPNVIPARYDRVVDTRLCTVIANETGATVSTVEHLMAAIMGCGIDNLLVEIDGPEMPIMDGSSRAFVEGIAEVGLRPQQAVRRAIKVLKPVTVKEGDKLAALLPAERFAMDFSIDFTESAIGRQERSMTLVNGAFIEQLSAARTFGRLADVEALRKAGLALGGSLDNAIVVDGARVLNPEGLRYEDEFVRHKMLDAVGDLGLAGAPIIGRYQGERAGHDMTNRLLRALFADAANWCWVETPGVTHSLGLSSTYHVDLPRACA